MQNKSVVPFHFKKHEVIVVNQGEETWFLAKDVCAILEHSNSRVAMKMLDDDEKGVRKVYTLGEGYKFQGISESGHYTLIIRSNKKKAKAF